MASVTIAFDPVRRKTKVRQGTNVLNAAIEGGVAIRAECGGNGICGKCRVVVHDKNSTSELTDVEKRHLSPHELRSGYRLACQTVPKQDVNVVIPKESRIGERRILADGVGKRTALHPLVRKFHVRLRKPTLSDATPDFERLRSALQLTRNTGYLTIDAKQTGMSQSLFGIIAELSLLSQATLHEGFSVLQWTSAPQKWLGT
jgi:uncharacterized 2Fe-2S/4Fe-4S cluster protein (DUF4445 family)